MNLRNLISGYDKNLFKFFIRSLLGQSRPFYNLIFQVTNVCNSRCITCFNWRILNQNTGQELVLDEIEKFTKKIGPLHTLTVGGGEPFLRNDLTEIIECFCRNNSLKVAAIPTNCLSTDKIVSQSERILENSDVRLKLGLSLDGLAQDHDEIRGVGGNFDKFLTTYQALSDLKKKYPRLKLRICATVFDKNVDQVIGLVKYVKEKLPQIDFLGLELLRGDYNQQKVAVADTGKFLKIIEFVEEQNKFETDIYKRLVNPFYYRLCLDILRRKTQVVPCRMAAFYPVIDAFGNVYPCENRLKIGNLRESDFDLTAVWQSPEAKKARQSIRNKECFCTHSCYQIPNIYMSPKMIFKIIRGKY